MKNVERLSSYPFFRVPMKGAPPLKGWAVQYVSGIDSEPEIEEGYWLTQWHPKSDGTSATFNFEDKLLMCFTDEAGATAVCKTLLDGAEIVTKVVKIGS